MLMEAEAEFHAGNRLSLRERIRLLEDMYLFSKKFEKNSGPAEKSPHVRMLVKLTNTFREIGKHNA